MGRRVINSCREAILMRLDHFCGIYGALSAGRRASESPAFCLSLGEANRQKVKLGKMAQNHLQEPRDIKIRQCKHNVSHFIQIISEAFSYIVL